MADRFAFMLLSAFSQVLYLGAAAGTTVSHVADIVGPSGCVYAVEFAHRPGRDLINMAKSRTNVIPIIEDARHPLKYRMLVGMVDAVFADVAQPDQARIVALNSHYFLKNGGHCVISIKASCVDSTASPEAVFAQEVGITVAYHRCLCTAIGSNLPGSFIVFDLVHNAAAVEWHAKY